jgi:flagellar export protein FliJ
MKRTFQFRLARLARLRADEEQAAKLAFAHARAEADRARQQVQQLLAELHQADENQARSRTVGTLDLSLELASTAVRDLMDRRIRDALGEHKRLEGEASRLQAAYADARREREVLTRLEDLAQSRHAANLAAADQAEADEAASNRHARRERA